MSCHPCRFRNVCSAVSFANVIQLLSVFDRQVRRPTFGCLDDMILDLCNVVALVNKLFWSREPSPGLPPRKRGSRNAGFLAPWILVVGRLMCQCNDAKPSIEDK